MARIILLLVMHSIGNFVFKGIKLNNLKRIKILFLLEHVGIYTTVLIILSPIFLGITFLEGLVFSLINGALHFAIDFVTGKFKNYYLERNEAKYIATIGFDQTFHLIILIATYIYMYPFAFNNIPY